MSIQSTKSSRCIASTVSSVPAIDQPIWLVAERRAAEQLADAGAGLVVRAPDLLLDDRALAVDLLGVEERVAVHVGEHVHGALQLVERDVVPVAGQLLRRVGVEHAARALDRLGDEDGVGGRFSVPLNTMCSR